MKARSIDIKKVAFLDVQMTGYEFSGPFAYLKHHMSPKSLFSMLRMQKMTSYGLSTP
jgi:hypothetical protein